MKTFFKVSIILMMAIVLAAGTALAAPVRLDSITVADNTNNSPSRVAVDAQGNVYVSVPAGNVVRKYSAAGQLLGSISVLRPAGLAVDASGNLYVCSVNHRSDAHKNAVLVYNADLVKTGALGSGEGEFSKPVDVAIDGNGRIYVVDNGSHKIKAFDAAGNFAFGAFGNTAGMLNKPMGLAINDAAGEIYVTDRPAYTDANGTTVGARVQVFDKNGAFKRSFGQFGTGVGQMQSPDGVAVDGAGTVYVADSGQNVVHTLNPADGSAVGAGGVYDPAKPGYNPSGVATTKNGLLYIVYQRGETPAGRIDKYGLDGFVTMAVDPSTLTFNGTQFSGNPAPQTIVITNTGGGTLNWSATADQAWIKLGKMDPVAPASAAGLAVGVDIAGLSVASYTGKVTIDSGFGQTAVIGITLNIAPAPVLNISNGWLSFTAKRGKSPAAQAITISIDNAAPSQQWSVTSDSTWLSITPASATSAAASVAVDSASLKAGSYTGLLTVSAPGVIGDGGKITVNLTVSPSSRIQVSTNREDAKFTISGPATYTGSGMSWSMDDVPAGDYSVSYDAVQGYKKPRPQTTTLIEDGSIAFSGDYVSLQELSAKKKIVVAKGSGDALVRAYSNSGAAVAFDLMALDTNNGANIAVGDIDGDGAAELIVGAGDGSKNPALVRIFRADKSLLLEFVPFGSLSGVHVAAGDLNGDDKAEVIMTPSAGSENAGMVAVYTYDATTGKMASTGISFVANPAPYGTNVATADLDGSGRASIVTAAGVGKRSTAVVKTWKVDTTQAGNWSASVVKEISVAGSNGASIAAADVDGDGRDEIVAGISGTNAGDASVVITIKADGTQSKFTVFTKANVTVAGADLDGDGKAEIIVAGDDMSPKTKNTVWIYSAAGEQKFPLSPFNDSKGSVNVAVGDLGL
ncbi:MAG: BACON domain-containing protein [Nitrospirota bacterium]